MRRYRWHTGATLRPVSPDEPLPVLFRDVGPVATARFLAGDLNRLAGPMTPITYMRSHHYVEPYTDHARIGRLVILDPRALGVWHSGLPHVWVAEARRTSDAVAYVPGHWSLADAATRLAGVHCANEVREALGNREHDEAIAAARIRLTALNRACTAAERRAEPLRRRLQSQDDHVRAAARAEMVAKDIDETDLCVAWHHLPTARRAYLTEVL